MDIKILQIRNTKTQKAINIEIQVSNIEKFKNFIDNPSFMYTFEEKETD